MMHRTGMSRVRDRYNGFIARHEVAWELSFAALAIFYVALAVVPDGTPWVLPVEWAITIVFAVEFFTRLWAAPSRRAYMRATGSTSWPWSRPPAGFGPFACCAFCGSSERSPASRAPRRRRNGWRSIAD
jgi:hypothetical protein